jgi:hypothetical protein
VFKGIMARPGDVVVVEAAAEGESAANVAAFGGAMVRVVRGGVVGDTVRMLGRTRAGEVVEMVEALVEMVEVDTFVGVGSAGAGDEVVVGPRPKVSSMLFLEEEDEDSFGAGVAGGLLDTNGNVSPLLPLVVACAGFGAAVVAGAVELAIGGALLEDRDRVVVTVTMSVVKRTVTFPTPVALGAVPLDAAPVRVVFPFTAGTATAGNVVSGGEEPGSLGTAGTMPTMPPLATAADLLAAAVELLAAAVELLATAVELLAAAVGLEIETA